MILHASPEESLDKQNRYKETDKQTNKYKNTNKYLDFHIDNSAEQNNK